jgi:hypothetical protein
VGQSAGFDGEHFSADAERSALIASVTALISEWDGVLAQQPGPGDPRLWQLGERSAALDARSRSVGFGGVGHHLSELQRLLQSGADPGRLRAQLEVVREMVLNAAQSLPPAPAAGFPPGGMMPPGDSGLEPPPLLTVFRQKGEDSAAVRPEPPRGPFHPGFLADPAAPPPLVGFGTPAVAAPVLPPPEALPQLHHDVVGAPPPAPRAQDPADPLRPDAPVPIVAGAVRDVGPGFSAAPRPAPFRPEGGAPGPNLLVRSMLGLRAFGKPKAEPGAPGAPAPAPGTSPSLLGLKRRGRSGPPTPQEPARGSLLPNLSGPGPLPHLGRGSNPPPHLGRGSNPPPRLGRGSNPPPHLPAQRDVDPAPPPMVNEGRSGLPALPLGPHTPAGDRRAGSNPGVRDLLLERAEQSRDRDSKNPRAPGRRARSRVPQRTAWDWRIGLLAGVGFMGLVAIIVAFAVRSGRGRDSSASPAASASGDALANSSSAPDSSSKAPLPRGRLLNENERFRSLIQQVHGRGKETPELRALLEEQASVHAGVLGDEGCNASPAECATIAKARELFSGNAPRIVRRRQSNEGWKSKWLAGLKMPEIPVEDDPRVQRRFEFYTENPVGRETFQQMLFRCGAHKDLIQTALIRRGLPPELLAVVFAESGCHPTAKSPAGAEGLWQFIPDAARAYHLRIIEGMVDERHSPAKSTEAAVRYFSDLKAKLDSWDLCFAAYNMGPFGLIARLERAGEGVGFWDLVDSELIPDETENYAPSIQAIALVLANLQKLKFSGIQMRAPQITADLDVPPSTRLGLIARAAATSVTELRRLNLDLKSDRTPNLPTFTVQVPKDVVWQARDTLQELIKNRDDADLCTPPGFDWGRQRFTQEMAQSCERLLANSAAGPEPQAPQPVRQAPRTPEPGIPETME